MATRKKRVGRANGEGSVYQRRADGRWCASVTIGMQDVVDEAGTVVRRRTVQKTVYAESRADAEAKLAELRKLRLAGIDLTRNPAVAEYLRAWLVERERNGSLRIRTIETYRHAIENYIVPVIGTVKVVDLSPVDVRTFLARLSSGERLTSKGAQGAPLSHGSVAIARAVLSRALQSAVTEGLLLTNAVSRLERERLAPSTNDRVLTGDEARLLFAAAQAHDVASAQAGDHSCLAPVVGLLASNLRIGEVLAVRWSDLDLERGLLAVSGTLNRAAIDGDGRASRTYGAPRIQRGERKTKNSRRTIIVSSKVLAVLEDHRRRQVTHRLSMGADWGDSDAVCASPIGTWLDDSAVRKRLKKLGEGVGITGLHPHLLRHTAATWALMDGASLAHVSAEMGHSKISMTADRYGHLQAVGLGAVAKAVDARL